MTLKLDQLFSDFHERTRQERERHIEEKRKREEFRSAALNTLTEIVVPVLRKVSEELKRRGHESTCSKPHAKVSHPSAQLTFKVFSEDPFDNVRASSIYFTASPSREGIEIRTEIDGKEGKLASSEYPRPRTPLQEVTVEWTHAQTIAFVKRVLDAQ